MEPDGDGCLVLNEHSDDRVVHIRLRVKRGNGKQRLLQQVARGSAIAHCNVCAILYVTYPSASTNVSTAVACNAMHCSAECVAEVGNARALP